MRKHESCRRGSRGAAGFTLVELLVVIAIILVLSLVSWPALQRMILRNKLQGFATEVSMLMHRGRLEAIKRNVPAVVRLDFANNEVVLFVDVDGDGAFTPDASVPRGEADFEVARQSQRRRVAFAGPADGVEGADTVNGFSANPEDASLPNQAVFNPDGSIDDVGGFRFGDPKGNFLEVRVEPAATARIELLKFDPDDGGSDPWHGQREGGKPWEWNT